MSSRFRQVALIGKYQTASAAGTGSRSRPALADIAALLQAQGCTVALEAQTAANAGLTDYPTLDLEAIGRQCDLGLVVGGDGTMLGIGRKLASTGVPLIGINHGRLGFMTDIPFGSFETVLPPMLRGEYEEERRQLMRARVLREGECVFDTLAMNDVVVHRGNTSGMVELRVEVDGHFVANQRADGLIVATPTGSTAYSLSAGGPILHPSIPGWVMAPIAPHTLSNRPVVLSSDAEVAIEIASDREAIANFDMQSLAALQQGDRIIVSRSEHGVRFLHPRGWSYFDTLRQKLHWNEGITGP
ncbi:MAG TPA: NAD kinase [Curvibacter sp.]|nr:NAD kinase [Curvibacter sp.]